MKVYITGDGPCPFCGKLVKGDDVETHHTHDLSDEQMRKFLIATRPELPPPKYRWRKRNPNCSLR